MRRRRAAEGSCPDFRSQHTLPVYPTPERLMTERRSGHKPKGTYTTLFWPAPGSNSRDPRELEPGVLCAKAFRFCMQRDAWNGSTPAMDHMMVSISPCHCPSVLSRHVPTSDCPGILGRRTRPRAVAVNASSKACVCTSTTLV